MEKKQLLSVSEYAEIKGISKQAVYKQLNNKLKNFVVEVENQKYIDWAVLSEEENTQNLPKFNNQKLKVEQQFNNQIQPLLEQQIKEKDRQIENLFKQIEQKDKQIETLQELLSQSQKLQAMDRQIMLEERNQKQKKKGLLKLFKKRGGKEWKKLLMVVIVFWIIAIKKWLTTNRHVVIVKTVYLLKNLRKYKKIYKKKFLKNKQSPVFGTPQMI